MTLNYFMGQGSCIGLTVKTSLWVHLLHELLLGAFAKVAVQVCLSVRSWVLKVTSPRLDWPSVLPGCNT